MPRWFGKAPTWALTYKYMYVLEYLSTVHLWESSRFLYLCLYGNYLDNQVYYLTWPRSHIGLVVTTGVHRKPLHDEDEDTTTSKGLCKRISYSLFSKLLATH